MRNEHLTPEIFVDVLEGGPVDASWRTHLEYCDTCRRELGELEQTLALVKHESEPEVETARHNRAVPTWWLTAAAMILVAVGSSWLIGERAPGPPETVELEELLPPVEEDGEFQLLQALSDASDVELAELAAPAFDGLTLDPSPLTPQERQRFVERLTEEMRSSL